MATSGCALCCLCFDLGIRRVADVDKEKLAVICSNNTAWEEHRRQAFGEA